jgi:hypothetical protein
MNTELIPYSPKVADIRRITKAMGMDEIARIDHPNLFEQGYVPLTTCLDREVDSRVERYRADTFCKDVKYVETSRFKFEPIEGTFHRRFWIFIREAA